MKKNSHSDIGQSRIQSLTTTHRLIHRLFAGFILIRLLALLCLLTNAMVFWQCHIWQLPSFALVDAVRESFNVIIVDLTQLVFLFIWHGVTLPSEYSVPFGRYVLFHHKHQTIGYK